MKRKVRLMLFFASFFLVLSFSFSEIVYLKDGSILKGKIVEQDEKTITIVTSFGKQSIEKDIIKSISFSDEIEQTESINPLKQDDFNSIKFDASDITLNNVMGTGGSTHGLFHLKLIDVENSQSTLIKAFIVDYTEGILSGLVQNKKPVGLTDPQIVDENGNIYSFKKIEGNYQKSEYVGEKIYLFSLPYKGRVPVSFEFERIPDTTKIIYFTLNNLTEEIDWQSILGKPKKIQ